MIPSKTSKYRHYLTLTVIMGGDNLEKAMVWVDQISSVYSVTGKNTEGMVIEMVNGTKYTCPNTIAELKEALTQLEKL
jgi:hypothetical protein